MSNNDISSSSSIISMIPNCPICLGKCIQCVTLCSNGHYSCRNCVSSIMNNNRKCMICRENVSRIMPNRWVEELVENIKTFLIQQLPFKINEGVDFLDSDNNEWVHGIIRDLELDKMGYLLQPDHYMTDNNSPLFIPFSEIYKIVPEFTNTPVWRNMDCLKNLREIMILLCGDSLENSQECQDEECTHVKQWIPAKIVFLCEASQHILCVFTYPNNRCATSYWYPVHSSYIKLPPIENNHLKNNEMKG